MYSQGVHFPRSTYCLKMRESENLRSSGKCTLFEHLPGKIPYSSVHFCQLLYCIWQCIIDTTAVLYCVTDTGVHCYCTDVSTALCRIREVPEDFRLLVDIINSEAEELPPVFSSLFFFNHRNPSLQIVKLTSLWLL